MNCCVKTTFFRPKSFLEGDLLAETNFCFLHFFKKIKILNFEDLGETFNCIFGFLVKCCVERAIFHPKRSPRANFWNRTSFSQTPVARRPWCADQQGAVNTFCEQVLPGSGCGPRSTSKACSQHASRAGASSCDIVCRQSPRRSTT